MHAFEICWTLHLSNGSWCVPSEGPCLRKTSCSRITQMFCFESIIILSLNSPLVDPGSHENDGNNGRGSLALPSIIVYLHPFLSLKHPPDKTPALSACNDLDSLAKKGDVYMHT